MEQKGGDSSILIGYSAIGTPFGSSTINNFTFLFSR